MWFNNASLFYKRPFFPAFSLTASHFSSPRIIIFTCEATVTRSGYFCCCSGEGKNRISVKPQTSVLVVSSTSKPQCFNLVKKKKMAALTDQYIVWTFFASLIGFFLLFILRLNGKNKSKKDTGNYKIQNDIVKRSSNDGDSSPENDSRTDIIIVGAGVAGAALAHTLGKVILLCSSYFHFFNGFLYNNKCSLNLVVRWFIKLYVLITE